MTSQLCSLQAPTQAPKHDKSDVENMRTFVGAIQAMQADSVDTDDENSKINSSVFEISIVDLSWAIKCCH
jgi:hypothetical protein